MLLFAMRIQLISLIIISHEDNIKTFYTCQSSAYSKE